MIYKNRAVGQTPCRAVGSDDQTAVEVVFKSEVQEILGLSHRMLDERESGTWMQIERLQDGTHTAYFLLEAGSCRTCLNPGEQRRHEKTSHRVPEWNGSDNKGGKRESDPESRGTVRDWANVRL